MSRTCSCLGHVTVWDIYIQAYGGFDLKYLWGCDRVQNYDGSWNDWSRLPDVPITMYQLPINCFK